MKVSQNQNGLLFQFFTRGSNLIDSHLISSDIVSVAEGTPTLNGYKLFQNYPNPFNPTTTITYAVPKAGIISIKVFDILGREVATVVNEYKSVGQHSIIFDGSGLTSGVYVYQLKANNFVATHKLVLLK